MSAFSPKERRGSTFSGWLDYESDYHGFSTTDSVTSELVADSLDKFSMTISKETFVVLDNRSKLMRGIRAIWEERSLFFFFLPPYSLHLNIAETPLENQDKNIKLAIMYRQIRSSMHRIDFWFHLAIISRLASLYLSLDVYIYF